jgi:hypothetical protein
LILKVTFNMDLDLDLEDLSVTRDVTATSRFVDTVRAILPACVFRNRPSGYVDIDGNPSHAMLAAHGREHLTDGT